MRHQTLISIQTLHGGGTWVEDTKGQYLIARHRNTGFHIEDDIIGTNYLKLTVEMLPAHNHTFTGTAHYHSVGAHAHGLNSHTHTYAKSNTSTGSTVLTVNQIPSHNHKNKTYGLIRTAEEASGYAVGTGSGFRDRLVVTSKSSSTLLIATGGGQGHTHTIRTTPTNSGAATGSTANSTAFNSGNATQGGTIGNTGSGSNVPMMPWSKICIRWHRTA